jgi:hypothetical protein
LADLRAVRLAAAVLLAIAGAGPALAGPDACALDNPVAICQGNQSAGIASGTDFPGAFTLLLINNLTADIAPAPGTNGVEFTSTVPITLSINLGSQSIITTGGGIGIFAASNGAVVLSSIGNIATSGDNGDGILAGSNDTLMLSHIGNITTTGNNARGIAASTTPAGTLMLSSIGNISTSGTGSHGIISSTIAGTNTVLHFGNIAASGNGSSGISASSGSGDISVTIASGSVSGGSGAGAGVEFIGGGTNTLNNFGSISALSGLAISGGGNDETVNNRGTITGNVDLGGGTNAFNNLLGGRFNPGMTVDLGGGTLTNAGILAPGGSGTVQDTTLTGDLVQTGSGIYAVDLDPQGSTTADFIVATGSATMNGVVATRLLSLPVGPQTYTIVVAGAPVTDLGATLLSSPALHAALLFNASLVQIAAEVNFASVSGLNANQQAISDSLHEAFRLGGGGLTPVLLGLLNTDSLAAYENALDQLSPAIVSDAQIAALYSSLGFASSLLSCRVNGTDTASIIREGQCLWAGASAVFLDQGTTSSQTGFDQTTGLFAAGAQVALDNVWRLGFGASYQQSWLETSTNAVSDGEQVQGGLALKYNSGPLLLAGVVNGGRGWYDNTRPMSFGGFAGTATSDSTIDVVNAGLRAAYVFGTPHLYWKPVLDAAVTNLDLGGFAESGGGGANLLVGGTNQTVYTIAPSLEVGTEWWLANGTLVRPFLRGGANWYANGDFAVTAAFLTAPAGTSPFTINTDMDDVMGVVGAGLDMITADDTALRLSYDGQLGETTQIHAVGLKGSVSF